MRRSWLPAAAAAAGQLAACGSGAPSRPSMRARATQHHASLPHLAAHCLDVEGFAVGVGGRGPRHHLACGTRRGSGGRAGAPGSAAVQGALLRGSWGGVAASIPAEDWRRQAAGGGGGGWCRHLRRAHAPSVPQNSDSSSCPSISGGASCSSCCTARAGRSVARLEPLPRRPPLPRAAGTMLLQCRPLVEATPAARCDAHIVAAEGATARIGSAQQHDRAPTDAERGN